MAFSQYERLLFPAFLLAFQIAFLILFGLLVEYDDSGAGQAGNTELLQVANVNNLTGGNPSDVALKLKSAKEMTKFYPSELRTLAQRTQRLMLLRICGRVIGKQSRPKCACIFKTLQEHDGNPKSRLQSMAQWPIVCF